ncbi:MAG: heat-shock protein HspR, partial [Schaalia hyovaginalis]|nr:heat-shock protein HspR [Schaalia hyovaginalis]
SGEVSPIRRGQRPWTQEAPPGGGELAVWSPWRAASDAYRAGRKVRAVIEAGPRGVRVIDASVSISS